MKVLPTTPNRLHSIQGQTLETNIREQDGKYFLSLFDNDTPVAEVPYDPADPDGSMSIYLDMLNGIVGKGIPGRAKKRPAPNSSQAASIRGRLESISFDGQAFSG